MSSKLVFVCFLTFSYSSYLFVLFSPSLPCIFLGGRRRTKYQISLMLELSRGSGNVWVVEMVVSSLHSFPYPSPNNVDIGVLVMRLVG